MHAPTFAICVHTNNGCTNTGHDPDRAMPRMRMRHVSRQGSKCTHVQHNKLLLRVLLSPFCHLSATPRVTLAALFCAGQTDVPVDNVTLNSLIKACLTGGALHNALGIFEWMVSGKRVSDHIPADIDTYNTLIRACHQVSG